MAESPGFLARIACGSFWVAIGLGMGLPDAVVAQEHADAAPARLPDLANPPADLLTPFEARRHAEFLAAGAAHPIDLLFLGDSGTEFWLAEGRPVWTAHYGQHNAANFGVQGARVESLLWRINQGEIDGFAPKVIVLDALWAADLSHSVAAADIVAGNVALIAEIRRRQPGAVIVLTVVPRAAPQPRPQPRAVEAALARRFTELADDAAILFVDVRPALLGADGQFDRALGSGRGSALNAAGYERIAQALAPVLGQFLPE